MKAAIHTKYGPPEVVRVMEVPMPGHGRSEVLIKVYASTVNRTDCGFRSAQYFVSRFFSGLFRPKRHTLGNEFAGIVHAVGEDVTLFKPGDKVFGYNDERFGAHAEFMIMQEDEAMSIMPANSTFEEAAALCEGSHYALEFHRAAGTSRGQSILINGATGAIGSAAVQLAKYFGAEVTAVCDSKNTGLVSGLGADFVIDYTKEDFTKMNRTFDIIFDAVGKSSFGKCKPLLKKKGIYMSTELGKNCENIFLALSTRLLGSKKVLFPLSSIKKSDVLFIRELVETGKFTPVIDRKYTLDQIVEAYRYVETGKKTGNVIISITNDEGHR